MKPRRWSSLVALALFAHLGNAGCGREGESEAQTTDLDGTDGASGAVSVLCPETAPTRTVACSVTPVARCTYYVPDRVRCQCADGTWRCQADLSGEGGSGATTGGSAGAAGEGGSGATTGGSAGAAGRETARQGDRRA